MDVFIPACSRARRPVLSRGILGMLGARRGLNLLAIDNLSKSFGSLVAVDNISLAVAPGRCTRSSGRTARANPRFSI